LRKAALVSLFTSLVCFAAQGHAGWAQTSSNRESSSFGGAESFGISSSYSPDSSHIFIGQSEQRRTWTAGFEFTHILHISPHYRFDYEGSVLPFYWESDPTVIGTTLTINHETFKAYQTPVRVVQVDHGPVGYAIAGQNQTVPVYAIYSRENTYAAALAPLGGRISAFPRARIQPSFSLDLGFVVSSRDIPIDLSDQFNYMFSFGPGVQVYSNERSSVRLEYIYRHISNAHQGYENPGVDQGVVRLTLSRHR